MRNLKVTVIKDYMKAIVSFFCSQSILRMVTRSGPFSNKYMHIYLLILSTVINPINSKQFLDIKSS